jgi:hypothetical protein
MNGILRFSDICRQTSKTCFIYFPRFFLFSVVKVGMLLASLAEMKVKDMNSRTLLSTSKNRHTLDHNLAQKALICGCHHKNLSFTEQKKSWRCVLSAFFVLGSIADKSSAHLGIHTSCYLMHEKVYTHILYTIKIVLDDRQKEQ